MKRSWIREANKYGVYVETRQGFRIYRTQDGITTTTETETRVQIERKPGHYVAIDKRGIKLQTKEGRLAIMYQIDIQKLKDRYN